MQFRSRSSSNRVLFFALAFLSMQVYVLYVSTFHMFHGMPPMCQLCATVKKYENSIASSVVPYYAPISFVDSDKFFPQQAIVFSSPAYHPRAPPSIV